MHSEVYVTSVAEAEALCAVRKGGRVLYVCASALDARWEMRRLLRAFDGFCAPIMVDLPRGRLVAENGGTIKFVSAQARHAVRGMSCDLMVLGRGVGMTDALYPVAACCTVVYDR
jgi:starvation-inducible outer membrane lipoprotein